MFSPTHYSLPIPSLAAGAESAPTRLARAWLALGVAALIGSGLLAVLLVLARTPGLQGWLPSRDFFRSALVVHVDLSVLIWFMAFAAVIWSLAGSARLAALGWAAVGLAAAGTAVMTVSPFFPDTQPLLNNYIPMLQQPVFYVGLALAGAGFSLAIIRALITITSQVGAGETASGIREAPLSADAGPRQGNAEGASEQEAASGTVSGAGALRFGALLSALAGAMSVVAVLVSLTTVPDADGQAFWEMVFWGGGHILQFQHVLLVVVAWFWLASELKAPPMLSARAANALFALAALPLLAAPAIYAYWPAGSAFHMAYFARLMEVGHPLTIPLTVFAAGSLWQVRAVVSPAKSAFMASMLLFGVGGGLAYMIKGVNVVIPAHYHGSIVGVTLAFMGLAYVLLPKLGFGPAEGRMARWQPYVYGGGQLIHILGLAWSGGYGVQRKVAGADQVLISLPQKIGMGMMGLGGLIAIVGGVMFVLVCLRAMRPRR